MSKRKLGFGLGASLLALTAAAPALGAVIDYPAATDNTSPIVLTDNTTQLQVITGTATQSGVISESGGSFGLEKIGLGTLVLTGANTYSGTTTISDNGVLQIGNNGATGSLGTGNVVNNATLSFNLTSTSTVANVISGSGILNQGGIGTLTLTGANTYTGETDIQAGATLALSGAGSIANSSVVRPGGTFDISALGSGTSIVSLAGFSGGQVVLGNNTLTITNGPALSGNSVYAGTITGAGGLTISGGSEQLAAPESYTGLTTIMSGAHLTLSNTGSIAASSGVVDNGDFNPNGSSIKSLTGSGILSGPVTITNASGTFSGIVNGAMTIGGGTQTLSGSGVFNLTVNNGATLTLTGNGNFVGANATATDNGTLDISGATAGVAVQFLTGTGSINLGNQTLTLTMPGPTFSSTFSGAITGTGGVTVTGGVQILSGANSYSGVTTIGPVSTLQLGDGGSSSFSSSVVIDNGRLVFNHSDIFAYGGVISGVGRLQQAGPGTLVLTGNNTFSGGTTITAGILQVGNGGTAGSISGNIFNNGRLVFDRSDTITFNGDISGSGVLEQAGTGTLILTGYDTHTGGTVISAGILEVGNINVGPVIDNGVLVFNNPGFPAPNGVISGSGSVRFIGTGVTTLLLDNTYSGGTTISAGRVNVLGSIGAVNITGGTLGGTGRVGTVTVASGGTLSPGPGVNDGPGTLTVQGNLALASGANYVDAISPTVTGLTAVSGTASVNGVLAVNAAAGSYTLGQRYTLLSAVGGLSGTFASVSTTGLNAYKTSIGYDANSVFLTLSVNSLSPLLSTGLGANGSNAAKAIDAAVAGGATLNSGFNALFGLSGAALGSAVTQLSGEIGADAAQGGGQAFLPFMSVLTAEGVSGSPTLTAANFAPGSAYGEDEAPKPAQLAAGGMRIWGTVFGRHTGIAADAAAGSQSLKAGDVGFAAGVEMQVSDTLRLGAAAGGGHGSFNAGNGIGSSDDAMLGVYGNLGVMDQGYVAGAFSYGWHDVDTLRLLTIFGTDLLSAKYTAHDVGARIEGGWRVALDDEDGLVPYAAFVWDSFQAPAYGERAVSGSGNFALSYAAHDTDFGQSELGLKAGRTVAMGNGAMALELSAAWAHQLYGAPFALAAFQALPGSSFIVQGGRIATDTALLGAGLDWHQSGALSFGARIDSQLGGGTTALGGTGTISLHF